GGIAEVRVVAGAEPADLFAVLAHVTNPEVAARGVDVEAPGVAQPEDVDVPAFAGFAGERIAGRDRIGRPPPLPASVVRAGCAIAHIDPQDLAQQVVGLSRVGMVGRLTGTSAD